MTSTYSSSTKHVTDGETTSHTTTEDINVTSAQIRWEGISGYPQTKTRPHKNAIGEYSKNVGNSGSISFPMPSRPSGTSYDSSRLAVGVAASEDTVDIDIDAPDGTTLVSDTLNDADTEVYTWSNSSTDGGDLTLNYSSNSGSFELSAVYRETTGTYDTNGGDNHNTTSNTKSHSFSGKNNDFTVTLTPSFPSVPQEVLEYLVTIDFDGKANGSWDCDFHADYDSDGTDDISGFVTLGQNPKGWGGYNENVTYHVPASKAGSDATVTFNIDPTSNTDGSFAVSAETRYVKTTKNPSVSGDVSGSYNGILKDGDWSPWQTLSGLTEGTNDFNHSIGQSREANFEFEYTYEFVGPDAIAVVRVQHDGDFYELPLADPSDSALENNNLRVNVNNETLVADLVDPSDQNATPVRVKVPNHGTLAWRKNL